jgi:hypothetical protein
MTQSTPETPEVERPRINSVWRARDGRRMRVVELRENYCVLDVLPPYVPRQRRTADMSYARFGAGRFLRKEADFG